MTTSSTITPGLAQASGPVVVDTVDGSAAGSVLVGPVGPGQPVSAGGGMFDYDVDNGVAVDLDTLRDQLAD